MAAEWSSALLRYMWEAPSPSVQHGSPPWPDKAFQAIFNDRNGWSVGDFWERCTFGLTRPVFKLFPWRILRYTEAAEAGDRGHVIQLARQQAADDGEMLVGFAGVVAFVNAWPSDAGANGRDARFDPGTYRLELFQHEVGHMLDFEHSFGPAMWGRPAGVYNDPYCVMGATGPFEHNIAADPNLSDVPLGAGQPFWRSGRRPAAATLYRHLPSFARSASVVHALPGQDIPLTALAQARLGEPIVAILPLPNGGELSIEYRLDSDDDVQVQPAVVVHSFGMQMNPPGQTEVRPPWFEAAIPPTAGAEQDVLQQRIMVKDISADSRTVVIRVEPRLHIVVTGHPPMIAIPFP